MFSALAERLGAIFKKLRSRGKLTEADVTDALREVRMALLEADVSLPVIKSFIAKVKEKAVGEEVWKSLTPGQLVIKHVKDAMVDALGGSQARITLASQPPTVILLLGLHGVGKTTTAGKLALHLQHTGHHPLLAAADVHRPAAITQLEVLGTQIDIPVFSMGSAHAPADIAKGAIARAGATGRDVVIVDTAGRLHIDEELMAELAALKQAVHPHETLLVVDAMAGQDAVAMADTFHRQIGIDGIILTKLDGDARGGAALSVKSVTGCPIKFVGTGEKLTALEPFHPDRMASRILGMGDILGLIEKAEATFDVDKAAALEQKIRSQEFSLEDYLDQLQQVRKMGPLDQILGMIPGFAQAPQMKNMQVDEGQLDQFEAIIKSMTPEERRTPQVLNASRRRRIAAGSGTTVADVNRLLKNYDMLKKMMKQIPDMEKGKKKGMKIPLWG